MYEKYNRFAHYFTQHLVTYSTTQKKTAPFGAVNFCAVGETRTLMTLRSKDFESFASTIPPPRQLHKSVAKNVNLD